MFPFNPYKKSKKTGSKTYQDSINDESDLYNLSRKYRKTQYNSYNGKVFKNMVRKQCKCTTLFCECKK